MIDYFSETSDDLERHLRRIKGNYRREFIANAANADGLESIPAPWLEHNLSMAFKDLLGSQHPQARGGEDLPSLLDDEGEVEIARLSLLNSVHGEVTSLRARPAEEAGQIAYRMVDEYDTEIELPRETSDSPLGADEVIAMFREAEPSPFDTGCEVGLQSFFYDGLDEHAPESG